MLNVCNAGNHPIHRSALTQKVCCFQEGALLGQLFNGIAPVSEDPLVSIDV
jgi:hypothetical protein